MQADVLIIEDIREMAELIALYLGHEGIQSRICETAEDALDLLTAADSLKYDLIVLDINLPHMDGYEFLQKIRKTMNVPVIIVSAREADEDIIMGLGIGADEYVTKPFSPKVLVARVRAQLRRNQTKDSSLGNAKSASDLRGRDIWLFGPYSFDSPGYLLKKNGERVSLSSRESEVLTFLISEEGRALSPQTIYSAVWKNQYGDLTTIAVYIQRLRRKIEENPAEPIYIQTVHGMGYRFNVDMLNGYAAGKAES